MLEVNNIVVDEQGHRYHLDITAPLYWWSEFDRVASSRPVSHKLDREEFSLDDFSCEYLNDSELVGINGAVEGLTAFDVFRQTIEMLTYYRRSYREDGETEADWYQMIQLLPASFNERRVTVLSDKEVSYILTSYKQFKIREWHTLGNFLEEFTAEEKA